MTQEEKQLLLQDLCARLPYETRVRYTYAFAGVAGINEYSDEGTLSYDKLQDFSLSNVGYERRRVVCILPYLRPMTSMTEEEKKYISDKCGFSISGPIGAKCTLIMPVLAADWLIDFYNEHHIDYRGLIEKGLAIEASEGLYK